MKYGYGRVSSALQEKNGNSLEKQELMLYANGCDKVYLETFTGTKTNRPIFNEVISLLESGDTLIVTKLDRFARTTVEGVTLIEDLVQRGVIVEILNMGRVDNTPIGKLTLRIMLSFAEYERDMIVERFAEGKDMARSKGRKTDGRYKLDCPAFPEYLQKHKKGEMTVVECCNVLGISRSLWYKLLKEAI